MAKKKSARIGRYRILGELGRGAMGIVYRAEDPNLDRIVALKTIILSDDAEGRKDYHKRFFLEAKAAGKLTHPHIVTTYDFGEEEGLAYMAMELLEGTELRAREDPAAQEGKNAGKDATRTVKLDSNDRAPAARAIGFDTRLPLSRQFDSSAALRRLAEPSRRERSALARAPRPVGIFRRLWHDRAPRRLFAIALAAALAGAYIAFG